MGWCNACWQTLPDRCGCCKCKRQGWTRIPADNCMIPSHRGNYSDIEMGAAIGRGMAVIMEAKRRHN